MVIFMRAGHQEGVCTCWLNLGACHGKQGDIEKAMSCYNNAIRIAKDMGQRITEAIALGNIGNILIEQKRYEEALEHFSLAPLAARREIAMLGVIHRAVLKKGPLQLWHVL